MKSLCLFLTFSLISVIFSSLFVSSALNAQTCFDSVQGKIAWDYKNTTTWSTSNINELCMGNEKSPEPGKCFNNVMHGGVDWGGGTQWKWQNALNLCKGSLNANNTISCFTKNISQKVSWQSAIDSCKAGASKTASNKGVKAPQNTASTPNLNLPDTNINTGSVGNINTPVLTPNFQSLSNNRSLAEQNIAKIQRKKAQEAERRRQQAYAAKRNNPSDEVLRRLDCDDSDASIHPFQNESCNYKDDNCDGRSDYEEGLTIVVYNDQDGDGFGDPSQRINACPVGDSLAGVSLRPGDCDDNDINENPISTNRTCND